MVDLQSLPIDSPVLELRPEAGRLRVTFRRLAAIYWLADDEPEREGIERVLRASLDSGEPVHLSYDLASKRITGVR